MVENRAKVISAKNDVPAVVISSNLNSLGVVRSLSRGRMPIFVLDDTRLGAAMWSRYSRAIVIRKAHGARLIETLLDLQQKIGDRPVLFATTELAVFALSEHQEEIQRAYRVRLPPHNVVAALANKASFHALAEMHGLPVPRSIVLRTAADLARLRDVQLPLMIKPTNRLSVHLGKTPRISQAVTLDEAHQISTRLVEDNEELLVQESIPGPDSQLYFTLFYCGEGGCEVSMFTGRKVRSNPPGLGSTALCIAAPEMSNVLEPIVRKFIQCFGVSGLGSLEFKWDGRTNRFLIIEPTIARTDWQEEIATLCGVNIPLAAYLYELGAAPAPTTEICSKIAWQEEYTRFAYATALSSDVRRYDGYWRLEDPMPGVFHYTYSALRAVYRRSAKPLVERWRHGAAQDYH